MAGNPSTTCLSPADGYRVWASCYDRNPNPMLCLEKRFLEPLLPPVKGLDVVDLGCGTGRWLEILRSMGPGSLLGVDSSPEMLEIARRKLGRTAKIVLADCADFPFERCSADIILCSFVLSYVEDAQAFLAKLSILLKAEGSVFLTDLHPETASRLNWRRGVQVEDEFREIRTFRRSIDEVIALCESMDLTASVCLEPRFGEPERSIFCAAGKQDHFETVKQHPAIYILQLRRRETHSGAVRHDNASETVNSIRGARVALGPQTSMVENIRIDGACIQSLHGDCGKGRAGSGSEGNVDLNGFLVLPGLVNAHDHLEFALFPRLGRGGYKNFLEWAEDIHHPGASPVLEHRQVPRDVRLWWGGVRNVLCGVTTVCHHNPYEAGVFETDFVIRVLRDYGWAHSLPMDADVAGKKRNTPKGQPFLVHLGEGVDEQSAEEVFDLHQAEALDEETIIIHGLALGKQGRALLRSARAGLIWCPSSNIFLFGRTLTTADIRAISRVAIGSDSPLTAKGDLLDELRFAYEHSDLRTEELYPCVTSRPSEMLRLKNGEGSIRAGVWADLIAVRDTGLSPSDRLAELSYRDVELVLVGGRVQLASTEMTKLLPARTLAGLQPLYIEGIVRWIRAPLEWMFKETTKQLPGEIRLGGKQVNIAT
jgi:cytosine/adenosine deaminase-related metal-dependent hydrolase/SAM-dependent methyltransferase